MSVTLCPWWIGRTKPFLWSTFSWDWSQKPEPVIQPFTSVWDIGVLTSILTYKPSAFQVNSFQIARSGIDFVKVRGCFNFYRLHPFFSYFVHWKWEWKSNDGKADPHNVSLFSSFFWLLLQILHRHYIVLTASASTEENHLEW